ncbi:MAG: type II toxin-antitoxin system RelE/ParE family toxin [Candidatus Gracilibacteria bacterium]|nr:type II toxin-antitoxin system RelE/ParE family toxin [Candidatus Gracilibacteria bacterium]
MIVIYEKKFLKDLKSFDVLLSKKVIKILNELKSYEKISDVKNIRKMVGYNDYYRFRFGEYRIGIKYSDNKIILQRILHGKDIYKIFP